MNADDPADFLLIPFTTELIPFLGVLEEAVGLPFWGIDSYQRFLEDFSEYFGFCLIQEHTRSHLTGFSLARAAFEDFELLKIGVAPEFQHIRLGTRLLEKTFLEAKRRGCTRCFLEVRKSNLKAIRFYFANGFRATGERINYYSNPVEDAWLMEQQFFRNEITKGI